MIALRCIIGCCQVAKLMGVPITPCMSEATAAAVLAREVCSTFNVTRVPDTFTFEQLTFSLRQSGLKSAKMRKFAYYQSRISISRVPNKPAKISNGLDAISVQARDNRY
jgi:hypothetical protein